MSVNRLPRSPARPKWRPSRNGGRRRAHQARPCNPPPGTPLRHVARRSGPRPRTPYARFLRSLALAFVAIRAIQAS